MAALFGLVAAIGAGAAAQAAEPAHGGTIQYGHEQEGPCLLGGWIQQWYLQRQYADNLVSRDADGRIVPWLATSWTISGDRRTYTFQLRPGVAFTDGTKLDAQAVVDNIAIWFDADPARRNNAATFYFKDRFVSARATAPLTLQLDLNAPYEPLLTVLSHATFGILSPTALARGVAANCEQPIGSGPFIVDKWNRGQNVQFRRNPAYNSAPANARHQGPAYAERLVWKFLKDPTLRYGSLLSGESNVIYDVPAVAWEEANKRFHVIRHLTGGTPLRLQLNTEFPPFDDIRVRRAFAHAADRRRAVEVSFLGAAPFEGNAALSQSAPDYAKDLADAYPYDPALAGRLLDEAGWTARDADGIRLKDGRKLTVRIAYGAGYNITSDGAQALQIIQEQAREVGFEVVLRPTTQADWLGGKNRGPKEFEIQPAYWTATSAEVLKIVWRPDDGITRNPYNISRFQDPRLWTLITEADATADEARRRQLYQDAQRLLVDSAAVVGFSVLPVSIASQHRLRDVWISSAVGEPVFHDAWFVK
ncbi:ABC transporter substrate-binding protein [Rhodovastum atsumiense]|uniref:ABC transporter substrate-binding protein n=1 Tax=Rhodovastum atsumiense TaxID=504468 RepID=A0A5M6IPK2_9PROT|nr:ABC transporter substrate-binding protein [Rhodovastum atsumiense]KAA5609887.1 ABC transporter substrate-binding protein [Rhodovastum atsumiense]CAH2602412.1 ABC transporter substrate-binding protein [Rhodovastum atsumiense]